MSLPLSRRIARVALLVAAGAAPVIGAAGAANAADLKAPELGGLSAVDGANLGNNIESASHQTGAVTTETGTKAIKGTVPGATDTVAQTGKTVAPAANKAAGEAGSSAGSLVGNAAGTASKTSLPSTGNLPLSGGALG
ncbi:ATP-binding protein [Streptomyces gamaensis]|uniref:ATP-binding protein n=1 Tax=Streptomyces gamaensis TaxID=1763542 RepID=A0ABW0YWP7_9ACTN